jgi:hypothetical protein
MSRRGATEEVDTPNVELEDISGAEGTDGDSGVTAESKPAKEKKAPARGDLPEGFVTPVGFATVVTDRELHTNKAGEHTVPPQMVYSYIRNASKEDPFPVQHVNDSLGHDRQVVSIEEGLAWWTRKNERVANRQANAQAKAAKKAEKATSGEASTTSEAESTEAVQEAE